MAKDETAAAAPETPAPIRVRERRWQPGGMMGTYQDRVRDLDAGEEAAAGAEEVAGDVETHGWAKCGPPTPAEGGF